MRRALSMLVGVALAGLVLVSAPAQAVSPSVFRVAYLGSDGPPPAAGTVLTFAAALESGGAPIAGAPVVLMARPYGGSTPFAEIAHGVTAADGSVEVRASLRYTSMIEWTYAGNDQFA